MSQQNSATTIKRPRSPAPQTSEKRMTLPLEESAPQAPPASTREKCPSADEFGSIVEIQVGIDLERKSFFAYKGVLSFYSAYFQKALFGGFAEAAKHIIELPTEEVMVFGPFIGWLYTGKVDLPKAYEEALRLICQLWAFGDRRGIPLLMNEMIERFRSRFLTEWVLPTDQLHFIYENSTSNAGLRRFVVDIIASTGSTSAFDDIFRARYPPDAMWDILNAMNKLRIDKTTKVPTKADVVVMDLCKYHMHEEGVTCAKTK